MTASFDVASGLCDLHGRPHEAACDHCGDFGCAGCLLLLSEGSFCQDCIAKGRVTDWLQGFRQAMSGKRDGWTWLLGVGAPVCLGIDLVARLPSQLTSGNLTAVTATLAGASLWTFSCVLFFMGMRAGRTLILVAPLVRCAIEIVIPGGRGFEGPILETIVALILTTLVLADTRNRLFFKLPVSDEDVRDLYLNLSNRWARMSLALILGLTIALVVDAMLLGGARSLLLAFVTGLAVIALGCGMLGIRSVDLYASPPVGGRGGAVGGVLLSLLWMAVVAAAITL